MDSPSLAQPSWRGFAGSRTVSARGLVAGRGGFGVLVAAAALALPGGALAAAPGVTEFSVPLTSPNHVNAIAAGPDGNLWFTESHGLRRVGRITPAGAIAEFPQARSVNSLVAGPDGNLWFTERGGFRQVGRIGKLAPTGTLVAKFSAGITLGRDGLPVALDLGDIIVGSDGNLWFTESWEFSGTTGVARVARITPAGVVTEFSDGITQGLGIGSLGAGPDGNVWFTELAGRIGRVTPTGQVTTFPTGFTGRRVMNASSIVSGADGNVWFTVNNAPVVRPVVRIGRITLAGVVTRFTPGLPRASYISDLALGPDGNLWFAATTSRGQSPVPGIRRITPTGKVTEFATGLPVGSLVTSLAMGPDGNLWFSEKRTNRGVIRSRIGRLNPTVAQPVLAVGIGAPSVSGQAVTVRLSCPAAARKACTGSATLLAPEKRMVIGKTAFSIRKGRTRVLVSVGLNAAGRALLANARARHAPSILPTLWVAAKDASGRSRQVTADVTIPVPR